MKKEIYSALIQFNKNFKGLKADGSNPFFKSSYITLDGILNTVRPILAENGLAVYQNVSNDIATGYVKVQTVLIHESGESIESDIFHMKPVPKIDRNGVVIEQDPQMLGSVVSYAKRYQLGALLGISESVDDDCNSASVANQTGYYNNNSVNHLDMLVTKDKLNELVQIATHYCELADLDLKDTMTKFNKSVQITKFNQMTNRLVVNFKEYFDLNNIEINEAE